MTARRRHSAIRKRIALSTAALTMILAPVLPASASETATDFTYPLYHGPRKTIAVADFDANGAFMARYGSAERGGGLAAMLVSELRRTERFIVVERAEIDRLIGEKQLALSNAATSEGPKQPLLGAQLFLRGSVTEFSEDEKGGGINVGFGLGGFAGILGSRTQRGTVAIDLRLIDAASGVVVASYTTRHTLKSKSLALQGSHGSLSASSDSFAQTPLGKAVRQAIGEAVRRLVAEQEAVPWQGLVARVDGDRVYINAGRSANLAAGDRMLAIRTVKTVTDPATGQVLGEERVTLGEIAIDQVEDRYAVGTFTGSVVPRQGDVVRLTPAGLAVSSLRPGAL